MKKNYLSVSHIRSTSLLFLCTTIITKQLYLFATIRTDTSLATFENSPKKYKKNSKRGSHPYDQFESRLKTDNLCGLLSEREVEGWRCLRWKCRHQHYQTRAASPYKHSNVRIKIGMDQIPRLSPLWAKTDHAFFSYSPFWTVSHQKGPVRKKTISITIILRNSEERICRYTVVKPKLWRWLIIKVSLAALVMNSII